MIRRFLLWSSLALGSHAFAQTPVASPAPDFSAGFKQLAALGMPALDANAKWSKLPEGVNVNNYEIREITSSLKGGAWLIQSENEKSGVIPLGGVDVVESAAPKKPKASDTLDPAKDAAALVSTLKKAAAKRDPDSSYFSSSEVSNLGSLLLFATQLHQTGHSDAANQLALAIFESAQSREAAVDAAVDQIASHAYGKAAEAFFSSGDWAAYHQAMTQLLKRFPRGWSAADAITLFLPQVEKQAAGTQPADPAIPGISIDPQALEIIRELTEKPPAAASATDESRLPPGLSPQLLRQMRMSGDMSEYYGGSSIPSSLWLLEDAPDSDKPTTALFRLARLKMAALPALAALVDDPFLTHLPNSSSSSYSSYYHSEESSEERAIRTYKSLNRPATRGEIAQQLLTATLPDPEDELDEADPSSIRELALSFWKDHQNSSREQIAAVFLRDGSRSQASQAATILASSADPKAHEILESHFLAADPAIGQFQTVQIYLRTRKSAAKPFFESYAKLVRSQTPETAEVGDNYDENAWLLKQSGGREKILKQLETLVGSQSPRSLAVQIAKGKPEDAETAIRSLSQLLAESSPTKQLFTLLEGANAASDAATRAHFITATMSIDWPSGEELEGEDDTPETARAITEPEAKVWRKLIEDQRELPSRFDRYVNQPGKSTVSTMAAIAFESSVLPSSFYQTHIASVILGKPATTLILERATARLAGNTVAPFPDATKVSKERLAEIIAEAGRKPTAEVHPYLATLIPDERAAWLAWITEPGDVAPPPHVAELQTTIIARSPGTSSAPDVKGLGGIDVGFRLTPENVENMIQLLASGIDQHSRANLRITRADFPPGLQVLANVAPAENKKADPDADDDLAYGNSIHWERLFSASVATLEENPNSSAVITSRLSKRNGSVEATWLIQGNQAKLQQKPDEGDEEEGDFMGELKSISESNEPGHFQLNIQILSKADAAKFTEPTGATLPLPE